MLWSARKLPRVRSIYEALSYRLAMRTTGKDPTHIIKAPEALPLGGLLIDNSKFDVPYNLLALRVPKQHSGSASKMLSGYKYMCTCSGSSSNEANNSYDEKRSALNRILYRSRQRGYLELDLILGKWTEENIQKLDDQQLKSLVEVLDVENPELWKWLTGQEVMPLHLSENPVFMQIHEKVMGALSTHAPSETRAQLGQPWVRGWDDNRKVGGPQAGNQ